MTPPTKVLDAARALGMKVSEIKSVESDGDELVVETIDGVITRVAGDGALSFTFPGAAEAVVEESDEDPVDDESVEETPAPVKKAAAKKAAASKPAPEDDDDDADA